MGFEPMTSAIPCTSLQHCTGVRFRMIIHVFKSFSAVQISDLSIFSLTNKQCKPGLRFKNFFVRSKANFKMPDFVPCNRSTSCYECAAIKEMFG